MEPSKELFYEKYKDQIIRKTSPMILCHIPEVEDKCVEFDADFSWRGDYYTHCKLHNEFKNHRAFLAFWSKKSLKYGHYITTKYDGFFCKDPECFSLLYWNFLESLKVLGFAELNEEQKAYLLKRGQGFPAKGLRRKSINADYIGGSAKANGSQWEMVIDFRMNIFPCFGCGNNLPINTTILFNKPTERVAVCSVACAIQARLKANASTLIGEKIIKKRG